MDILKAFSLLDTEYPINIQGTLENPLFQANQIGKLLGIKNVNQNISDYADKYKVLCRTYTPGGIQETTFLTEFGLYRLLGHSRKEIAATFQNWIVEVLREIRINGMYKLHENKDVDQKLIKYKCAVSRHDALMKSYHRKSVVYICKMKEVDNKYIIKIGSTQNIKERIGKLSLTFSIAEPLLFDIFESNSHTQFERKIHNNEIIKNYSHKMEIKNGEISKETYLVDDEIYKEIIKNINKISPEFQNNNVELVEKQIELANIHRDSENENHQNILEQERIKLEQEQLKLEHDNKIIKQREIELEIARINYEAKLKELENKFVERLPDNNTINNDVTTSIFAIKQRVNSLITPKVYQYSPDNLNTPIREFNSPVEVERAIEGISPTPLKNASKNNTIYKEHRWLFLERAENLPETIPPTVANKNKTTDVKYIAMIDIKKTKIMAVYSSQKEATQARNMKCNSFTRAITQGTISSGHYWNIFDKCSPEMQEEFLANNELPEKHAPTSGKRVEQIDPRTNTVLKTYHSNREIVKLFQISSTKLRQLLQTNEIYNGYKWRLANT